MRSVPTVASENWPSGLRAACTIWATVPTWKRASPPPTSLPRSMSTTPNRASWSRQCTTIARYRGSNTRSGKTPCGNSTVPNGNIGNSVASSSSSTVDLVGGRLEAREESFAVVTLACREVGNREAELQRPDRGEGCARPERVDEVGEHAGEHRARSDRVEVRVDERSAGVAALVQLPCVVGGQDRTLMERVDVRAVDANQEVPRHADAVQVETAAAADLDHEDAQGDREPEVPIEHDVEVRVARIAVVDGVAREPTRDEQLTRECDGVDGTDLGCERVERSQPRVHVDGVIVRGDQQGGFVERNVVVGLLHDGDEALGDVHARTVPARRGGDARAPHR